MRFLKFPNGIKNLKRLAHTNIILFSVFFAVACTTGHCPNPKTKAKEKTTKVWVFKYDQSKQCQKTLGISEVVMMKEFKELGVTVFESKKQYDGLMRVQACGAFTGLANLFLIPAEDLDKVTNRGFQKWDF